MNILFLTTGRMDSIEQHAIYPDLLRCFRNHGHKVYTVSTYEKRVGKETECIEENGVKLLHVKVGNLTQCNFIEKGISTIRIENQYKAAIKKYFSNVKFDLVLYTTPPITFAKVIQFIKKRDGARSYLMLKDIFPQNSVDLGMLTTSGLKGVIYKYFRAKEEKLYELSDTIGCMSQANCDYVIKHNPKVNPKKVEICPNCIEPIDMSVSAEEKIKIRKKYELSLDRKIFVYGGNFGRPQDVPFIVKCLKACKDTGAYFVIVGSGTDGHYLEEYVEKEKPDHVKLFGHMPKDEYDRMIACCDVGLIFLDHRFTIPNFPSRLLSYMQVGLPVLACTDRNTDVGTIITENDIGWWCESSSSVLFRNKVQSICRENPMLESSFAKLKKLYNVSNAYDIILKHKGANKK